MAEPIVQSFVIDTGDSEQKLNSLNTALNDTGTSAATADTNVKPLTEDLGKLGTNSDSLKAQLRELQKEFDKIAATDAGSARYQELASQIANVKEEISNASTAINNEGVPAFQGFTGNLGDTKEKLFALDFKGAADSFKGLASNIANFKAKDFTAALDGIKSGFVNIGKALYANPLFAIVGALAAVVAYWDTIKTLFDGVTDAEIAQLEAQRESAKLAKEEVDSISQQEETLKRQGYTQEEINAMKIDALNIALEEQAATIATAEIQAKAQLEAAERNKKILTAIINALNLPLTILLGAVDGILLGLNKVGVLSDETYASVGNLRERLYGSLANMVFDPAEVEKSGNDSIKEAQKTYKTLLNQRDALLNQIDKKNSDAAKQEADKNKAKNQAKIDEENKLNAEIAALREEQYQASLDAEGKELRAVALKYQKLREAAGNNAEQLKALQELEAAEQQAISDKFFEQRLATDLANQETANAAKLKQQQDYDALKYELTVSAQQKEIDAINAAAQAKITAAQGDAELLKIINAQTEAEIQAVKDKYAAEDKVKQEQKAADEKALLQGKLDFAKGILGNIASITDSYSKGDEARAKKAFKVQKAVSIAQATIDTYEGAQAAFTSTQKNPVSVLFPAAPYIAAGAAVAAGIANVASIAKQQFQGSTPPSTNETPPPSLDSGSQGAQPAQFNPLASQFLNNRPEQVTPRAYVLAGDVANQQEVRTKVEDLSRIG